MAAGRIKGITIEIGADTTKLTSALSSVDRALSKTQTNLRDINKALKLDPGNTELIKDKQIELNKAVEETKQKLDTEREALEQLRKTDGFDENSEAARNLKTQIDLDTAALQELEKQAKAASSVLGQQMQAAGQHMQEVGNKIKSVGDNISGIGNDLTTKLTLPIVGMAGVATAKFAEVDKTMTLTNATMKNTEEEAQLLDSAMKDAAANSTFGMNDAAQATLNFARAGLDAQQAADALAPAMNLAAGEAGSLDTVSAGLVGTINGFGDSFDQTAYYADVFAAACNNSALDIDSLSNSMGVAAPVFHTAGRNVEDAAIALGVMANANIDADKASNALKTGLMRLADEGGKVQKSMESYGIATSDIWGPDGQLRDITEIQHNLNASFKDLNEQQQLAAASAIFGKNQGAAWLALINAAPSEVDSLANSIRNASGTTDEMSSAMMSGFGGSIEKMKSSLDVLMTTLGQLIATYLTPLIEKIQAAVDWFMSLDKGTQDLIVRIGLIVAAIGPVISIIGGLVSTIGTVISVVGTITSAIGAIMPIISGIMAALPALGSVIAAIASPIGIVVAAIAAVIAIGVLLYKNWDEIKEKAAKFGEAVKNIFENIKNAISEKFNAIKEGISNAVNFIKNGVTEKFNAVKNAMGNAVEGARGIVSTKLNNIKSAFEQNGGGIKGAVAASWTAIKEYWKTGFDVVNALTHGKLGDIVNAMKDKLGGLAKSAFNWGRDIISGLVDGIRDKISSVAHAISDVADTIRSYIHFSEPDVGPLKDFNTYMPDMTKELAQGMIQGIPQIESAMNRLTSAMVPSLANSQFTAGTTTNTTSNSVSINVYGAQGQDINELANIIENKITNNVVRRGVAFG